MAYQTYITDALVCSSYDRNTSDRSFLLFSREAGMVYGVAKSVREERSKQRFALQDFSYIRVSLIRGKAGWRLAGAEALGNLYAGSQHREARTLLRNIIRLIKRTMHGEVPHPEIFDDVLEVLSVAHEYDCHKLECVLSLRILAELGYVAPHGTYEGILQASSSMEKIATLSDIEEKAAEKAIERALTESQL